jgi:hypothetical protein
MNEAGQSKRRKVLMMTAFLALVILVWLNLTNASNTNQNAITKTNSGSDPAKISRGKYLVEEVAKCPECHTPRDAQGNLDSQAWLEGAPIWIRPIRPIQNWADNVPALAGLPSFRDEQMFRVLEKGTGPEGEVLRPPMHVYHMKHEDAEAIIAYLKSLPVKSH